MIAKQTVEAIALEYLKDTNLTLAEVSVNEENDIEVYISRNNLGVSIDDCVNLSRHIESKLDRDKEDFSLMVSSTGVEE